MKYTLFSASWCAFCQPVKKLIEDNNLPVEVLDIDDNVDATEEADIQGIPTLRHPDGSLQRESQDIIQLLKEKFNV